MKNKNTEIMKFSMSLGCRLRYAVRKMTYDNEAAEAFWNGMSFSKLKELCWKTWPTLVWVLKNSVMVRIYML